MTERVYNNLPYATLREAITASDTEIALAPGGAAVFLPNWSSGKIMYLTITDPDHNVEIVKVTGITGDVLTVERQQGGTTARSWNAGAIVCQRGVAADFENFIQKGVFRMTTTPPDGVLAAEYDGEKVYESGADDCHKRWHINRGGGTNWDVLAGEQYCFGDVTQAPKALQPWPMRGPLTSIAQNGNKIIALGGFGDLFSEDGGATWRDIKPLFHRDNEWPDDNNMYIAFGNDIWVAYELANNCGGCYSTDNGETWSAFYWGNYWCGPIYRIRFLNGQFIAVGKNEEVQVSTDGKTWTQKRTGGNYPLYDIGFDGTNYVACGGDGSTYKAKLLKSTDLNTWTEISHGISTGNIPFYSIVYGGGKWVAGGNISSTDTNIIWSTDLTTWHGTTAPDDSGYAAEIIYGNSLYVIVTGGYGASSRVLTSSDADTWTAKTYTLQDGYYTVGLRAILYTGSQFIAVGQGFDFDPSYGYQDKGHAVVTSTDGASWAQITPTYADYVEDYAAAVGIIAGPDNFLAFGSPSGDEPNTTQYEEAYAERSVGFDPSAFSGVLIVQI
ncbi:MAG TPA: hypothetical protein ENG73_07450 [Desulfobacterales bacterium]|nr:hypothetical protein [Desulfobacterales bacterium]